jgi:hypothetical protein
MSPEPRMLRTLRPSLIRSAFREGRRALRLSRLPAVLALAFAPCLSGADGGDPLANDPGVPRIVMRSQVEAAAAKVGIRLGPGQIETFRIAWDGGEAFSLGAPVRVGQDAVRFLHAQADGSVVVDTLPMSRVRTIGIPPRTAIAGETFSGIVLAGALPFLVSSGNPVHFFMGMSIWGTPFSRMPEFRTLPAPDYFNRPRAWTGSVSATLSGIPRTALYFADRRRESVPAWKLEVDAGPRRSAMAFVLSLRMLSMNHPFTSDPPIYPNTPDEDIRKSDSLYEDTPTAFALSPGLRLTWAETDRLTIYSQTGVFFSLTPYYRDQYQGGNAASAGPELGAGLNWWLTKSIGVRGEGALLVPVNSNWDLSYEPSVGAGIVYRYDPRPPASFQLPVTLALMAVRANASFGPQAMIEVEDGTHQSAGIGTMRIASNVEPSGSTNFYPDISKGRFEQMRLFLTYGLHGDRSRRAYAGVQFLAGLETISLNVGHYSVYDTSVTEYSERDKTTNAILEVFPEAGIRLGRGFGFRMQWHILRFLPVLEPTPAAFAAGFTYTLPGIGERR